MDALLLGLLLAVALAPAAALWTLLVRPDAALALLDRGSATDEAFFAERPAALSALRWVLAGLVFLLGFLAGLGAAFLAQTP